jgi:uncharacterized protein (TIGR02246 family)
MHRISTASAHRTAIFYGVALIGLVVSGCDSATATEATPSVAMATDFDGGASNVVNGKFVEHNGPHWSREDGIIAAAAAWDEAWNAGNAIALASLFVDGGELVNGRGQVAAGLEALRSQHAALFAGAFRGSRTEGEVRRITFLTGNVAIVDINNKLTGYQSLPPGTSAYEPGIQRGRHKRVLVKRGNSWRIQSMQITQIAPGTPLL